MDNFSAVRYINKLEGTHSRIFSEIAKEFWHFCIWHRISVKADYILGWINMVADWHSRYLLDLSEWRLHPLVF